MPGLEKQINKKDRKMLKLRFGVLVDHGKTTYKEHFNLDEMGTSLRPTIVMAH